MKKTITLHFSDAPEFGGKAGSIQIEVDDTPKPFLLLKKGTHEVYFGAPANEPCHACKSGPVKYVGSAAFGWCQQWQCEACGAKFEVSPPATGESGTIKWVNEFYVEKK